MTAINEGIMAIGLHQQQRSLATTVGYGTKYAEKGVVNMFPWQIDCLCSPGVLSGGNLVYSAPTSAGKTLVAEILAIKTILERKKKVFFILPFVSVVREKMFYFKELLSSSGVHVHGFMGSHVPPGGFKTTHLAVCTIEKANGLINRLIEERELEEVGCVIVDELHLLGDPHRGYLLELLLAKIKFVSSREAGVRVQIIGMSATLPNLSILANWLDAALYCTDFRPVPLTEFLKVESYIYKATDLHCTSMKLPDFIVKDDPGDVIKLCIQTLLDGHSVLVFCPTKNWCEALAQQIASEIRKIGCGSSELSLKLRQQLNSNAISDLLEQLKRCPVGLETSIGKCVSFGVAYHHAGLTLDERDILESSFRQCVLRVLVATSTLSSGVNLPARRVIVRSPLFGGQPLDILSYKQMVGRAGRMGKDTAGESFLVCKESERKIGEKLVNAELPSVESCLGLGNLSSSLKRAVLEVIASGVVTSLRDVKAYTSCTLFAASQRADNLSDLAEPITACIEFLQKNQFIRVLEDDQLTPTNLGEACLSAALPPDQALRLLSELHKARQCFVLDSELHVIYQVTPFSVSEQWRQLDWMSALNLWENLSPSMQRVGELIGVEERFLVRAIRGNINTNSFAQMEKLSIFRRFYTALALQDLVNEVPLVKVAEKYKCSKGMLQSLQQSASTFAGMVTQFCRRLGWSGLELLVSQFSERLQFGVQRELIDLLRIDCISALQARALFNSNIQSLSQLATSRVENVEKALRKAVPFESEENCNNEENGKKKYVCLVGRTNLTEREAANLIINEARNFLQVELGLKSVDWINYSTVISEKDNSELSVSSPKESYIVTNRNKLSKTSSPSGIPEELDSDVTSGIVKKCDTNSKSSVLNSSVIINEKCLNVKTASEAMDGDNCIGLNAEIELNHAINSPVLLNENNLVSKQSLLLKNSSIEGIDSENLNEVSKGIDNSHKEKANYRNSLDMFEESENSSCDEEGDSKFRDVICSLSLYDSKISKISHHDDCTSDESEFVENEPKKVTSNDEKVNSNENPANNSIVNNDFVNGSMKYGIDLNSKENMLLDFDTQFENMVNKKWDSIFKINNSGFKNEKNCLNEETKKYKIDSEEESEILLRTPMLESKSRFDFSSKYGSRCNTRLIETSLKDKEEVMKSKMNCMVNSSKKIHHPELIIVKSDEVLVQSVVSEERFDTVQVNVVPSSAMKLYLSPSLNIAKDGIPNEKGSIEKDIIYSDSTLFNELKTSTPVNRPFVNKNVSTASSVDLFDNSPLNNIVQCSSVSINSLDDMDINWGGDSILQNSMLLLDTEEQKNSSAIDSVSKKRKHSLTTSDYLCSKRMKLCDESVYEVSPSSNPGKIIGVDINVSKKVFVGKNNLVNNNNSVKKLSLDKNSEIFIESPFVKKNCGLYESLCIDSQMCNVLDNVNLSNNSLRGNFVVSNSDSVKFGVEQSLPYQKKVGNSHDDFKKPCNSSVKAIECVKDSVNGFKTPSIISGCLKTKYQPLKNNTSKNLITNKRIKDCDSPKENNISEFKISDSILETAAGFQSMVDFKEEANGGYPKINEDLNNSIKSNEGKDSGIGCILPPSKYNTSNPLKSRKISNKSSETDFGICGKTKLFSKRVIIDNSDFLGVSNILKGHQREKEKLDEEQTDEFDDLISSSQEDLHSTSRIHTRSMISRHNNDSVHLNKSSVSQSNAITAENVCNCENKLKMLKRNLARMKMISVALNITKKGENLNEGIGARILARRNTQNEREGDFSFGSSVLCGLVIYWGTTDTFYLDMRRSDCNCIQIVKELFLRDNITVIMFDLKSQIKLLYQCCQFTIKCKGSDPIIADWILSPSDRRKSLKQMVKLNGIKCPLINDERNTVREAVEIWHLDQYFHHKMKQAHLLSAYTDIEMPVQFCLCNMEISGFGFDKDYAELLWDRIEIKMAELLEIAYQIAGRKFNPRSKADINKIQKFLGSTISENCQELEVLLSVMQKWRKLNSLKARSLSPVILEAGTRLFGDCVTTTQTGRVSMHEPNLQNIPKDVIIDDEVFSMRTSFVASPGFVLVSADYCQLELRILAHFSEDRALLDAFHSSSDIFIGIAAAWHNISETKVTAELRHHTKQICYGLIYGMGVTSLSEQMELSELEAKEMIESFKAAYPTLQVYLIQCVSQCRKTKEVRTLFNRVRFLPDIVNKNSTQRSQAERQAVNTTIQGSAADIAKLGMLKVECSFQKHCPSAHLVLQLHDELIYEVPSDEFNVAVKIIKKEMENACELKVPLPVKVKAGPSWGQLEVLDLE